MAEKDRRGEDAADDGLDELFDEETVDDEADDDVEEPVSRSGGTATRSRTKADADERAVRAKSEGGSGGGLFGWFARFFREVVAELRKVIWPTRNELLTYTAVVIVFVSAIVAIVVGLDYVFAKGVLWVFGNPE